MKQRWVSADRHGRSFGEKEGVKEQEERQEKEGTGNGESTFFRLHPQSQRLKTRLVWARPETD